MGILYDLRRFLAGSPPVQPYRPRKLGPTKIVCRQGEIVKGCQKELQSTGQVAIGTSPTIIRTNNPYRDAIVITNTSNSVALFVGPYYVSLTLGQEIPPLQSLTLPTTAEIWGIAASAITATWAEIGQ